ncbi:MAG TPA: hypothetical protein VGT61_09880 [Thermomicrobiales bacterium]|jgi:ribosomal protein S6--L-glutamate ligase|nr:hypothetical protein [Thermomicrobiales bacterium]
MGTGVGHGHGYGHGQGHGHDAGPGDSLVIAVAVESRYLADRAVSDALAHLEAAGCEVRVLVPEPGDLFDIPEEAPAWDAIVSRGRSQAVLALLSGAAAIGVHAVNPVRAIDLVRNKVAMQTVLVRHGIPVPRAWFADHPAAFRQVPADAFPLVVKPFDGDSSIGLSLVSSPDDAGRAEPDGPSRLYIAQEYLEADGWDLKLYGIGSDVWAVRKRAPVSFDGNGPARPQEPVEPEPVALDAHLRDIALTCGRACGLELWGVDVALTARGPYVIEVNDFPTYSAVTGAGERIAGHIAAQAGIDRLRRRSGQDRMRSLVWSPS